MLTAVFRRELIPLLQLDPVLHYYPRLACLNEPDAPLTIVREEDGVIGAALVPCDPPGGGWMLASTLEGARALLSEVPARDSVMLPIWADSVILESIPRRKLETDAIAVCSRASLRSPEFPPGAELQHTDRPPQGEESAPGAGVRYLACSIEGSFAGSCAYRWDELGGGSVERLIVEREWMRHDLGQSLMAAAAGAVLENADWVVFLAAGRNQALLGTARTVGFRTCYWLKMALPAEDTD